MFDPTGKATITIQNDDGTTEKMEGFIVSMDMSHDQGGPAQASVSFLST